MLILRDVPNPRKPGFWDHQSGDDNRSVNIIIWPADDGAKQVDVRIGHSATMTAIHLALAAKKSRLR
jgi:hypothetical protein